MSKTARCVVKFCKKRCNHISVTLDIVIEFSKHYN